MIQLHGLTKRFADRVLFADVSVRLSPEQRYALVGSNGSGKSTLLRILMGLDEASDGRVEIRKGMRVGYMRQFQPTDADKAVLDVAMAGDESAFAAIVRQRVVLAQEVPDAHELGAVEEEMARTNAYGLGAKAAQILDGLGLSKTEIEGPMSALSGGYRLRVLLGQALCGEPDALFLDEPTNHLDILSIEWLEQFLRDYSGIVVVVSHDHTFLRRVATRVLDVDYETVTPYTLGYDKFLVQKAEDRARRESEIEAKDKERKRHEAFVTKFKAQASKARQAQSRVKQMEKIVIETLAQSSRRRPVFRFEQQRPSGKDVVSVEGLCKAYGEKSVLNDISLTLRRGQRVALVGKNGIGKSTLLNILAGEQKADDGAVEWGHETHVGLFAQDHGPVKKSEGSPFTYLCAQAPTWGESAVRGQLAKVLFTHDDVKKPLKNLSGGEAARLLFAGLTVKSPNVLLLDEPTNHLDIEAIEALADAVREYPGTVLFVSHNRWFVEAVATDVILLTEDGVQSFDGLLARRADEVTGGDDATATAAAPTSAKVDRETFKRQQREKKKLEREHESLMAEIETLESAIAELDGKLGSAEFYQNTAPDEQARVIADKEAQDERLLVAMTRWEEVEAALADLPE